MQQMRKKESIFLTNEKNKSAGITHKNTIISAKYILFSITPKQHVTTTKHARHIVRNIAKNGFVTFFIYVIYMLELAIIYIIGEKSVYKAIYLC